jgi:hypothetical protein
VAEADLLPLFVVGDLLRKAQYLGVLGDAKRDSGWRSGTSLQKIQLAIFGSTASSTLSSSIQPQPR